MQTALLLVPLSIELITSWLHRYFIHNLQVRFLIQILSNTGKDQLLRTTIDRKLLDIAAMKLRFIQEMFNFELQKIRLAKLKNILMKPE